MEFDQPDKLEDVLKPNLRVVICGTAAGTASALRHEYYAGRNNRFWGTLAVVKLTPYQLKPSEFRKGIDFGLGLTDLAKKYSGADLHIPGSAYDPASLSAKIGELKPKVLAFNGKNAFRRFLGWNSRKPVEYGPQSEELWIGQTELWVLPSTSGSANGYWNVELWRDLAQHTGYSK